ncbi:MAG: Uma2 family endonuclease [Bacteroidota bacterium]
MTLVAEKQKSKLSPKYDLVFETLNGKPFYRKGYRDVLKGRKTIEDIMPCSSLQWVVVEYLLKTIFRFIDDNQYWVATNEAGLHLEKNDNTGNDIAIYSQEVLPPEKISVHYADVPPKIIIEVEIKVELEDMSVAEYLEMRINHLLDFGVEKVIWVLTKSQKIVVGRQGHPIEAFGWGEDIEIMDGHTFNVKKYLKAKRIPFIEREEKEN